VLRHRAADAACACLTVDAAAAAAYSLPEGAAQIEASIWFSAQLLPKFNGFFKKVFFCHGFLQLLTAILSQKTILPTMCIPFVLTV